MDSATTSRDADEEWELYNDDGFVYKRKKRRLDPAAAAAAAAAQTNVDPQAEERSRRERKRRTLLKLKAQYQREIDQWELLSNMLSSMEEKARVSRDRSQNRQLEQRERGGQDQTASFGAFPLPEFVDGSLVDELLLQVEAQEAIVRDLSNLCDVAEAMFNAQEEQLKQSLIDLPIWASPHELMASLCDD
ncbi:hypothetical protein FH972_007338 [Carpinus fangiana]|uniref:Uncharacterized protein n=1 Tax=Carpinus fangiana TaxID=176857 RepID=A0A5N6QXH2_9ROSI|nr:hypothetical protein FH972_007338 [Carpinus fangiana]